MGFRELMRVPAAKIQYRLCNFRSEMGRAIWIFWQGAEKTLQFLFSRAFLEEIGIGRRGRTEFLRKEAKEGDGAEEHSISIRDIRPREIKNRGSGQSYLDLHQAHSA